MRSSYLSTALYLLPPLPHTLIPRTGELVRGCRRQRQQRRRAVLVSRRAVRRGQARVSPRLHLSKVNTRLSKVNTRLSKVNTRLSKVNTRLSQVNTRLSKVLTHA